MPVSSAVFAFTGNSKTSTFYKSYITNTTDKNTDGEELDDTMGVLTLKLVANLKNKESKFYD